LDSGDRDSLVARVEAAFRESISVKEKVMETAGETIVRMAELTAEVFRGRKRLFIFGNGGSAADSQHLAAEFVNRFRLERAPLPALALTVDSSVLTSIANDYHFDEVFEKQLKAFGHAGDAALGLSTSGRSPNVVRALKWARENGLHTLGLAGEAVTEMDAYCDLVVHVPSPETARVQEVHLTVEHIFCQLVEAILFS
jgi:D-sedoheptulose 7-phosphate isomerase